MLSRLIASIVHYKVPCKGKDLEGGSRILLVYMASWQLLTPKWLSIVASKYCLETLNFE